MKPFELCKGPRDAKIVVVGEAPGEREEAEGLPFVGPSGNELNRMLGTAGLVPQSMFFTNVFTVRPPKNKIEAFCAPKKDVGGADYKLPPLAPGKYIKPEYLGHLDRLAEELCTVNPEYIIGLGRTASWALLHINKIGNSRGTWQRELLTGNNYPVFMTYHPAAVLRQWKLRPIVIRDFMKILRGPTEPPERKLLLEPTLPEIEEVLPQLLEADLLVCDIETFRGQIDCIGFAPSQTCAVSIPFFKTVHPFANYWPTLAEEQKAWNLVRTVLESPVPKLFQNGLYDMAWLFGKYGIRVRNAKHDSMILAHALWPEMDKDLASLAKLFTDEAPWKFNYRTAAKAGQKED